MKKDEKTGQWKTVQLSQCRLKVSQRLRERSPFIKLEQMKGSRSIIQANRPTTSFAPNHKHPAAPLLVENISVTDTSSDEDDGGLDDSSIFSGTDSISLRSAIESLLGECEQQQEQEQQVPNGKRFADSLEFPMFETEFPQRKRPRTVSFDQDSYADMLLKEAILLDDISVDPCEDLNDEGLNEFQLVDNVDFLASDNSAYEGDMLDFLEVLF